MTRLVGLACPNCKAQQKEITQKFIAEHDLRPADFIGAFVQLGFPVGDRQENMWVIVKGLGEKEELLGELNNHPTLTRQWKLGDYLEFMLDEIILIIPPKE